jgi:hypothetical protein
MKQQTGYGVCGDILGKIYHNYYIAIILKANEVL